MKDTTIAVDLAKNVFEIAISREAGKVDSGGFEFRAFIDFFDAYEQVLREGCFTPSRVSTMMPISLHPLPLQ